MTDHPYGNAFARWRSSASPAWQQYTEHDFVQGLGDGSLPQSAFLEYLQQDYIFLIHFSRAWVLAIAKSETLEEMQAAAATVDALVNHEMQLHVETCAAAGIDHQTLLATKEAQPNLAYTRYVLEAGYSGDWLDLMAALAPCVLGYGEIGARLLVSAQSDIYRDWIETYGGEEYQQACHTVGRLIDKGLTRRLGESYESTPRWQQLCARFQAATALEVDFWGMAL